ncbi:MAG: hypothetical protein JNG86_22110, partial [Verrucomicrobiaceae bacterium]|nr:hypothetical protein [Verrucomicrobiaceae bacterium]
MISPSLSSLPGLCAWLVCMTVKILAADASVIGTVEDFDTAPTGRFQQGFIESHRWTEEFRQRAKDWSSIEVVPEGAGKALRVRVNDAQAFTSGAGSILRLAPFFPPQADALRIRMKVVTGQASIYVGGPTAYYANSDVFTEPQTIRALAKPEWVEVVCSFNHPTWRNYRRSGFSTDAPRNYYSRWAQEHVGVFLAPDSLGEILIDRIDLVALGEGKPFATFSPAQIQPVRTIADFEDGQRGDSFTLYMAANEAEWFDESWTRSKPLRFEPMKLAVIDAEGDGGHSLECSGRTAEEVHCAGVRTKGAADANAIAVTVSVDAPEQRNMLVGAGPVVPLDFLVFVAPEERPFPWHSLAPSDELRSKSGPGFDYNLTHRAIAGRKDLHFAIYQTRRYLKPAEWSKLVLPAADFTCIYGQGTMRGRFLQHGSLRSSEVIAVAWLNPWCRQ